MSLADRLNKTKPVGAGLPCKIGNLLYGDKLTDEDKAELIRVLEVPYGHPNRLPNTTIAAALREEGHDVGDTAVNKHRRGACRCYGNSPKFSMA